MTMKNEIIDPLEMKDAKVQEQIELLSVGDILSMYRPGRHARGEQNDYNEVSRSIILTVDDAGFYLAIIYCATPGYDYESPGNNYSFPKHLLFRYPWRVQNAV